MPLLDEAAKISCLADFQELPANLQAVALRRLIELARARHAEMERQARIQRVWLQYEPDECIADECHLIG